MKRLRDLMTPVDKIRYLIWRVRRGRGTLRVRFTTGEQLVLRPFPANDVATAYEVFVMEVYRCLRTLSTESVRRVVDLGANVGYSTIYWTRYFPDAHVLAFEPHPAHVDLFRRNLELNNIKDRVTLKAAAAGVQTGQAFLTDADSGSKVRDSFDSQCIPVSLLDLFEEVGDEPIDLMKIDIEGSEYTLLSDPRFSHLKVNCIVLEWHGSFNQVSGKDWCMNRLSDLGYTAEEVLSYGPEMGLIWAFRNLN